MPEKPENEKLPDGLWVRFDPSSDPCVTVVPGPRTARYIRADLFTALEAEVERLRELEKIATSLHRTIAAHCQASHTTVNDFAAWRARKP